MPGPKKSSLVQSTLLILTMLTVFALQAVNSVTKKELLEEKKRTPAAIGQAQAEDLQNQFTDFRFDLSCEEFSQIDRNGRYPFIRVSGKSCGQKLKAQEIEMTNLTNGLKATVFRLKNGFTSDLIRLKPGQNRILVVEKFQKGKEYRRTLTVVSNSN